MSTTELSGDDVAYLAALLQREIGIVVDDSQSYLLQTRLTPVALTWNQPDVASLVSLVRRDSDRRIVEAICGAMTTNETSFFRDEKPFNELRERIIPELIHTRRAERRLRIWCAASSTGQEPYSLAIMLREDFPELASWDVEILATDVATHVLDKARAGRYSHFEVNRGLGITQLMRFFDETGDEGWTVNDDIRRMVRFEQLNLTHPFGHLVSGAGFGPSDATFDLVFCRNVLIYFDIATRRDILDGIGRILADDGWLFLGAAESVHGVTEGFARDKDASTTCFRSVRSAAHV